MLTCKDVAGRYGVCLMTVSRWITKGQLAAINLAVKPDDRPRYRITEEALKNFEERRSTRQEAVAAK